MSKEKNHAASIRARLLNLQRQRKEPFDFILRRYALERLLFRLGQSVHQTQFILKGGLLLSMQSQDPYRPTKDLDLLGHGPPTEERLSQVFRELITQDYPEDGLVFSDEILASPITADQKYEGVRLKLLAYLQGAKIPLQIDIGFGGAILKPDQKLSFDTLLDLPNPDIFVYPLESVMTEKLHALVELGLETSRMKDIFDLDYLAKSQSWSGKRLAEALHLTFTSRQTQIPKTLPEAFTPLFFEDTHKLAQWQAFSKKLYRKDGQDLKKTLEGLRSFWWPLIECMHKAKSIDINWSFEDWAWKP